MFNLIHFLLAALPNPDSLGNPIDSMRNIAHAIVNDVTTGEGLDKMSTLITRLFNWSLTMGGRVVGAMVIFIIGRFVIRMINKLLMKLLSNRNVEPGVKSFLHSLVNALLMLMLIIAIVNKLGVETTSFAALLAAFGVAIGMAMSNNLSNLVGGILILMFKPYRVGDWIKKDDILGHVEAIEIFHTVLRTYEGTRVYLANGAMSTATVINYSKHPTLRIEYKVSVEYGQDYAAVEQALLDVAASDKRVLPVPKPYVALDQLGDNSVNIILRLWVKKEDYWDVRYGINRQIYERFNAEGISFAFPQVTVHQA
jgi:small conductance mechanosensitive channel